MDKCFTQLELEVRLKNQMTLKNYLDFLSNYKLRQLIKAAESVAVLRVDLTAECSKMITEIQVKVDGIEIAKEKKLAEAILADFRKLEKDRPRWERAAGEDDDSAGYADAIEHKFSLADLYDYGGKTTSSKD